MRQDIRYNPATKLFEAYSDFSGGMNAETSNEKLKDNEYPTLDNVDLSGRGSARRRTGRVSILTNAPSGKGQGIFHYYRQGQAEPDIIMAVGGKLYLRTPGSSSVAEIPISGLPSGFQTNLSIEAVQYKETMFIATGTKLVEYDGTTATVVTPYQPTAMEAIYIGTNGLADNPDAYIQDQEASELGVAIKPTKRTGVTNIVCTMTAFVSKPASMASVDYKWEYRKVGDTNWTLGRDFTTGTPGKSWDFIPKSTGKYEIKCTVRDTATPTTTADYTITNYPVNDVEDKANQTLPVDSIQTCRKIMLHWDRLILAKDNLHPHQMYISDLNNPRYFPTTNSINFDANKQEPITAMVRYRDMLVVFTKTTIQTLTGKSPADYRRALIHDGIGCISDRTAHVIGNHIVFLSNEGVQLLAPSALTLDTMNVKRIDNQIKSKIVRDPDACGLVHDNQYWLCLPSQREMYRFYYDGGVWVRDKSSKLNLADFAEFEDKVYELTLDGKLYKQDSSVYADDSEVYNMVVESKYLDLSTTFNQKKLKRLYVLAKPFAVPINLSVKVYADSAIVLTPDSGQAVVNPDGSVTWQTSSSPNMHFYAGTVLGQWVLGVDSLGDVQLSVQRASVRGKCRRVKVIFMHAEAVPCEIYAYGLEFKQKKV